MSNKISKNIGFLYQRVIYFQCVKRVFLDTTVQWATADSFSLSTYNCYATIMPPNSTKHIKMNYFSSVDSIWVEGRYKVWISFEFCKTSVRPIYLSVSPACAGWVPGGGPSLKSQLSRECWPGNKFGESNNLVQLLSCYRSIGFFKIFDGGGSSSHFVQIRIKWWCEKYNGRWLTLVMHIVNQAM